MKDDNHHAKSASLLEIFSSNPPVKDQLSWYSSTPLDLPLPSLLSERVVERIPVSEVIVERLLPANVLSG